MIGWGRGSAQNASRFSAVRLGAAAGNGAGIERDLFDRSGALVWY